MMVGHPASPDRRQSERRRTAPSWAISPDVATRLPAALPVGIIVVALVTMLLVPLVANWRTASLREDLDALAEPSRSETTRLHLALAMAEAALHDFLVAEDAASLAAYHQERAQAQDAVGRLEPMSTRLGPEVDRWLDSVRANAERWNSSAQSQLAARGRATADANGARALSRDSLHSEVYTATLVAAAQLDAAIARATRRHRERIETAERIGAWVVAGLGTLALAGTAAAWWLGVNLRRHAMAAERRRQESEQAMVGKARLMRGVSHDLKNPLNVIDGHAQLLEEGVRGPLADGQRDSVARIRRAVRSLLGLVGDLLDLAAAEARELRVDRRPTDVAALVDELLEEHRAAAAAAGLHLSAGRDDGVSTILTDSARVHQIVGNLLSNAIKYTPAGGHVSVWLRRSSAAPAGAGRRGVVEIAVSDTGPGIPPDARDRVFDEFVRLHSDAVPGAGLGLAISRQVARALGGEVRLAPPTGTGATFVLELPLDQPP